MKPTAIAALVVLLLLTGACGDGDRTNCAIAKEKLDQCLTEVPIGSSAAIFQRLPLEITDDCSGLNGCAASCVKDASCGAMRYVLLGHSTDPNAAPRQDVGQFSHCLDTCIETYRKQP